MLLNGSVVVGGIMVLLFPEDPYTTFAVFAWIFIIVYLITECFDFEDFNLFAY